MKKTIKVIYEDGVPVDLIDTADKTTVVDYAKLLGITAMSSFATPDEIVDELDTANPFQREDGDTPADKLTTKQKKMLIRKRMAERDKEIQNKVINKFFTED